MDPSRIDRPRSDAKRGSRTPHGEGPPRGDPSRIDPRRWIYAGLDLAFAIAYVIAIEKVLPNRLPSAQLHLWTLPLAMGAMGVGTLWGERRGWYIALAGGSVLLLSTFLIIVRILISAAFLAGVYGAFGKAAATFSLMAIALVVEVVVLLPLVQVKYLMSRAGRRAYGAPASGLR